MSTFLLRRKTFGVAAMIGSAAGNLLKNNPSAMKGLEKFGTFMAKNPKLATGLDVATSVGAGYAGIKTLEKLKGDKKPEDNNINNQI